MIFNESDYIPLDRMFNADENNNDLIERRNNSEVKLFYQNN